MSDRAERIQRFCVPIATPNPGAPFIVRPTGRGIWRVLSIAFDLVTSGVAGNRAVAGTVSDGTSVWQRVSATAVQAASLTGHYSGFHGTVSPNSVGTHWELSWPEGGVVLNEGCALTVTADAIDPADQFSAIAAMVEELPSGRWLSITPVESYQAEVW
jgi:hypothetical protein